MKIVTFMCDVYSKNAKVNILFSIIINPPVHKINVYLTDYRVYSV